MVEGESTHNIELKSQMKVSPTIPVNCDDHEKSDPSGVTDHILGETSFQQRMSSLAKHEVVKENVQSYLHLKMHDKSNIIVLIHFRLRRKNWMSLSIWSIMQTIIFLF